MEVDMVSERIVETNEGIQDALEVKHYDEMCRYLRDKGYMETNAIIKSGIKSGEALEVGPGPGYLGLEWLKKTVGTRLTVLEISANMIELSRNNAREYGLLERISYVEGNALSMPFDECRFDAVFSNGSMHEWEDPLKVFSEMIRVLKRGGRFFVSDLRRDMNFFVRWFLKKTCRPKIMVPGLISSLNAAYIPSEISTVLKDLKVTELRVKPRAFGLEITGVK